MATAQRKRAKRPRKPKAPLKLDLGIGQAAKQAEEGWTGVDLVAGPNVDVVADLFEFPWPFEDDSVGEVFASHFVEHVPDLIGFMDELYRVCGDGGLVRLVHPYLLSRRAWQDPTHKQFLSESSWPYYNRAWREANRLDHYPIRCDFEVLNIAALWQGDWGMRSQEAQQFAMAHYWEAVSDLVVDLRCVKSAGPTGSGRSLPA